MVNVKVRTDMHDGWRKFRTANPDADPRFDEKWLGEHCPDEDGSRFWTACEWGWETLSEDAREVFGRHVVIYAEGRSGGWCVVSGLRPVDEWDAITLAKWRRFEKWAKAGAADIPYQIISDAYCNDFQAWADEESELAAPAIPEAFVAVS
jgi:hypothetical protein